ncbi:MAG: glycogen/starch synthase, partial [Gammaproteobacteria bacterium]
MPKGLWIIAAENGAIPGGTVGGVGDVIHHLPPALAGQGWPSRVITPAYGRLHGVPGARPGRELVVQFAGERHRAQTYRLPPPAPGVDLRVIDHPLLAPHRDGRIYHPDAPDRPFETDSVKFAFFCAAVAAWAEVSDEPPRLLHLNDWHTGLIPALRAVSGPDSALRRARCVFTIHNLAYQGVRPLDDGPASFSHWFPDWPGDTAVLEDPRYDGCMNFMAAALRLCDGLSTVSPSYAREIQQPSDPAHGFAGGEGLESELSAAAAAGRLTGILNGCDYPPGAEERLPWETARQRILEERDLLAASGDARERLERGAGRAPGT